MDIYSDDKNVIIEDVKDFDLREVLECGQCFNFVRADIENDIDIEDENKDGNAVHYAYSVIAKGRYLFIEQEKNKLIFHNTTIDEYKNIWENYFDLDRDYGNIKEAVLKADDRLTEVVQANSGIRILNQDFFETLISFIISQNKQIPQIKQVVRNISELCGEKKVSHYGETVYLFPTLEKMTELSDEQLRACKTGFRAPYIMDAINKVAMGKVTKEKLNDLDTNQARELLMTIKGVGEKVANCVLLFGLGRREAFPVDVWMKRIMEDLYFKKDTKKEVIEKFACEKYGEYAGYAQQYLFIYGKETKVGAK